MDKIEKYIDELLEKSTPDKPIWNIEKILQGLKSTWNYIDGCMIKAILEMYSMTKDEKYFQFADNFIDCKVKEDGSIEGYSVEELNIDNVNAGKTLFELYDLTGKEKYRGFICASRFIWNMRRGLTIRKIMTIYFPSFSMWRSI